MIKLLKLWFSNHWKDALVVLINLFSGVFILTSYLIV